MHEVVKRMLEHTGYVKILLRTLSSCINVVGRKLGMLEQCAICESFDEYRIDDMIAINKQIFKCTFFGPAAFSFALIHKTK